MTAWKAVMGGYGQKPPDERQVSQRVRIVDQPVHAGRKALLLDAVGLEHEVDVYSQPMTVKPHHVYHLQAFVRQLQGDSIYKVTIDWQTAEGRHIRYDNDWQGNNRPQEFALHGSVFVAPPAARQAVLIIGVQKGVQCAFDDVSFRELGETEPLDVRPRRDGDGKAEISGHQRVEARGFATWRVTYTCGESGLPIGGAIVLRRTPVSYDWSPPQGAKPLEEGFVRVESPRNALFEVRAGGVQEVIVKLNYPALQPREKVEIVLGDGKGMRAQGKLATSARWVVASDCDADGKYRDLPQTQVSGGRFEIVPGAPAAAWVVTPALAKVGEPTAARVEVRDAAGNPTEPFEGRCRLTVTPMESGVPEFVEFQKGKPAVQTLRLTFRKPGVYRLSARLTGGNTDKMAWLVVSQPPLALDAAPSNVRAEVTPNGAVLANEHVALLFPRNPEPFAWGCGWLMARDPAGWRQVATLPAAGRVMWHQAHVQMQDPVPGDLFFAERVEARVGNGRRAVPQEAELVLSGSLRTEGGSWLFAASYRLERDARHVQTRLTVQVRGKASLVALHAPLLYAGDGTFGERKTSALFPGLEFLTAEECSSDDFGVAWSLRERWIPHPYKITVPLMAVAGGNTVTGLMWDPLQKWDATYAVPLAHFASPNRREQKANHLMALLLPGLTDKFVENVPGIVEGWSPPAGSSLALNADLFALQGTEDVADAVRYYAQTHPLPPPNMPRSPRAALLLSAKGFTKTGWDAKAKGWISAVGWKAGADPTIADRLLQIAALSPDREVSETARAQVAEALGGPRGVALNLRTGDAEEAVSALREAAYAAMSHQHAEGYWTFAQVYSTEDNKATLAQPDDVEIGTCVNMLEGVLNYAVATGDPKAVEAGLRGLEYIKRFSKPAGSESWEVPLVNPNLRAAALATRCYLRGWQLTGREEYLQLARRWAWAGASFIYVWQAPDRPAMPGASISVMGTTFYTHPWFGAAVQWVGLVYAEVLQELARYDHSFAWQRIAELITASALHQQKTDAAPCGHSGFYPDSYSLVKGADYYEWCLAPTGIVNNVIGLMGYSPDVCVNTMEVNGKRVHLLSVAQIVGNGLRAVPNGLRMTLRYFPGETFQVALFGLEEPKEIRWNGKALSRADGQQEGVCTPFTEKALILRLRNVGNGLRAVPEEAELVIEGARLTGYQPPQLPDRLINGGFENGEQFWFIEPQAKVVTQPHSGQRALLMESPDPQHEVQANSRPMRVEGGRRYRLQAWVWQVDGDGSYKVTIDWLDATGQHVAYDNDWKGNNRPRSYQEHGGVFTAPPNAAQARIILGCRGARCLFDDVALAAMRGNAEGRGE